MHIHIYHYAFSGDIFVLGGVNPLENLEICIKYHDSKHPAKCIE